MYPESPLDEIPTGRNPHWTESPLDGIPTKFHAVGIPYIGARNPHWTESPQLGSHRVYMYCNLALQRHCELWRQIAFSIQD